jgi:hypothetical protein
LLGWSSIVSGSWTFHACGIGCRRCSGIWRGDESFDYIMASPSLGVKGRTTYGRIGSDATLFHAVGVGRRPMQQKRPMVPQKHPNDVSQPRAFWGARCNGRKTPMGQGPAFMRSYA